jgi:periplasmic protein TonB
VTAAAENLPSLLPDGDAAASLLPAWMRLTVNGVVIALHLGLMAAFMLHTDSVNVLEPLNIDLIPQGDYMMDTVAIEGAAAAEPLEQHQTQQPQLQPAPTDAPMADEPAPSPPAAQMTPPEIAPDPLAKEAELQALEQQREIKLKKLHAERVHAQHEAEAEARREARIEERRREIHRLARRLMAHHDEARNSRSSNQGGSESHRAGAANGQSVRAARANYGAVISAELNRHKFYPPGARARGETGSVGVSFTVGGSGRIAGHSIFSSSGNTALDGAVHQMMASAHAPPPPGGSFHGSIVIRFNLGR